MSVLDNCTLKNIVVFVHAAQSMSMSEAGRELDLAPAVVSKTIMKMEEAVGMALFARTTRTMEFTPGGRALFIQALKIYRVLAEIDGHKPKISLEHDVSHNDLEKIAQRAARVAVDEALQAKNKFLWG